MTCIVVDDDEMARASMQRLCDKVDDLDLVTVCENGLEALTFLRENTVDLAFLDIEMPELTGLELVKSAQSLPMVVFTTGKKEYAAEAFEYEVIDFLPKPVTFPRFLKTVDRARSLAGSRGTGDNEIFIKTDGRYVRLDVKKILYIETLGDYVTFRTEKEKYIVHSTLKKIDEKLQHTDFLKVHRSFIVNLRKIVDIEETNLVIADKVIPISRAHRPILMNRINLI